MHCVITGRKAPKTDYLRKSSTRDIYKLKIQMAKTPPGKIKTVFDDTGLQKMGKTAHCKTKALKPLKRHSLNQHHKTKRLKCVHTAQ